MLLAFNRIDTEKVRFNNTSKDYKFSIYFILYKKEAFVEKNYCVACGSCLKVYPINAISINNGIFSVVDIDKCVGCGKCSKACPASTIEILSLEKGDN